MADIFDVALEQMPEYGNASPQNIPIQSKESNNSDIFDKAFGEMPQYQQKSQIPRHLTRSASRAVETVIGLPGDILSLFKTGLGYGAEKIANQKEDSQKPFLMEAFQKGPGSIKSDEFIPEQTPTSQDLAKASEKISKGFTSPQSENEMIADELVSDITSLAIPVKGKIPFARAIGTALGANLAKQGIKTAGGSEKAQDLTKLGSFFLLGSLGRKSADKFVNNLYEDAKKNIPDKMIPTDSLLKRLDPLEKELMKGLETTTKKQVLGDIRTIKNKSAGGALPFDELVQSYRDINETMNSRKLFEELSRSEQKLLKNRIDKFKGAISDTIQEYGKSSPEFLNSWRSANEGYAAIQNSKKVSKNLAKIIKEKESIATKPGIALLAYLHPQAIVPGVASVAGAYGVLKTGEVLSRISKSPVLRKHYLGMIKDSVNDNTPSFIRNVEKFNKEYEKEAD